jgi:cytidylate kinase
MPDRKPVSIAISGKSGCGNTSVSGLVAEKLGLRLINYTFHTIAEEKGIPFKELQNLAEADSSWDKYLDRRQVEMAEAGNCVLGSRLAIWLMPEATLRVYLYASREVRADRIRRREGGEHETVLAETEERDRRDHERYKRIYGIDNDEFLFADLVINTENFTPEQEADLIVTALRLRTPERAG